MTEKQNTYGLLENICLNVASISGLLISCHLHISKTLVSLLNSPPINLNILYSITNLSFFVMKLGFSVVDKGCCGVGRNNGQITCLPYQTPCQNRTNYLFWDAFHPTESANLMYARKMYGSTSPSDVYPMNIQQLAMA